MRLRALSLTYLLVVLVACGGATNAPRSGDAQSNGIAPATGLHVPKGFTVETIASVSAARELAPLPNGDLIVGTEGRDVFIVPKAEGAPASPQVFATIDDDEAAGVTFVRARSEIYVATEHHVWAIAYHGERKAPHVVRIADVRSGPVAPGTDGDIHRTTSVAFTGGRLYAAAGSSCNATMDGGKKPCTEPDPTRAAVSVMNPDGSNLTQRAKRIRNAIALAVNPQSHSLWVGGAGQDDLPFGHPYEYLDDLSRHPGDADYGWPECEENHHVYWRGYDCRETVEPLVELPAYSTIVGAAFYPSGQAGAYAFPSPYQGALFAAVHGSWHTNAGGCSAEPPRVVFVPMDSDRPKKPVDWKDPTTQWTDFLTGFQTGCTTRIGRATGIAVGPKGSLFVADDDAGLVYRIRPSH
jgi:glucose/arabinose dehydrogenase